MFTIHSWQIAEPGSTLHALKQRALIHYDVARAMTDTLSGKHATLASGVGLTYSINAIYSNVSLLFVCMSYKLM